jgi:N-acetylmuramoyl-L-alanine amidase
MKRLVMLILVTVLAASPAAGAYRIEIEPDGRRIPARTVFREGILYIHLADVARALSGSRHWNPRNGKAALVAAEHRFVMVPGNAFVVADGEIVNVHRPVLFMEGEFWVPQAFLREAVAPALHIEVAVDRDEERIELEHLGPLIGAVTIEERAGSSVVVVPLTERADIHVESLASGAIEVFVSRAALTESVDVAAPDGYVSRVTALERQGGTLLEIGTSGAATSYRVDRLKRPHRIEIVVEATVGSIPTPALRSPKELLTEPTDPFSSSEGIEVVMIDPGYGGRETGTVGRGGVAAKDAALEAARRIGDALQRRGFYVFMTRSSDSFVPIERRCELANLADADLFLAIRWDAWVSGGAGGFQVHYYRAPAGEPLPVVGPRRGGLRYDHPAVLSRAEETLLWRSVQEQHVDESRILARLVRGELRSALPSADRGVRGLSHTVLEGCAMPAVVVDLGFLTSGSDVQRSQDESFMEDAAEAIARGVEAYRQGWKERNQ